MSATHHPPAPFQHRGFTWGAAASDPAVITVAAVQRALKGAVSTYRAEHWVLDYTFTASGRACIESRWRDRAPHQAHLYAPGIDYTEDLRGCTHTRSAFVVFHSSAYHPLPEAGSHAVIRDSDGGLGQVLEEMADIGHQQGHAGFCAVQALLWRLFDMLRSVQRSGMHDYVLIPAHQRLDAWSQRIDAILDETAEQPVSLAEIAHRVGMSPSGLAHRYARETGDSVISRHARLRADRVRQRLLQGQSLKQIAEEMGFCDAFYVSRFVRRWMGVTPTALRLALLHPSRQDLETGAE